jgi:hypothetical protein
MAHRHAISPLICCSLGAGATAAMALALMLPARADGGSASSLLSRQDAIQQATLWMPRGAQITSTDCTEMIIDSSVRYFCSVQWGPSAQ